MEDRTVPAQFVWTYSGTGSGLASVAANWTNTITHGHAVPAPADYALFGTTNGGSNTSCLVTSNMSVDRVVMDSTYTKTLAVAGGDTLSMANFFQQYSTLSLAPGATVSAGGDVTINGNVVTAAGMGAPSKLSTPSSFYIEPGATIVASNGFAAADLILSAGAFDDSGILDAGLAVAGGAGALTLNGSFVENPGAGTFVFPGSVLTLGTGGNSSALADIKGNLTLAGGAGPAGGAADATLVNTQDLWIDGGNLAVTGTAGGVITGNLSIYNNGTAAVGLPPVGMMGFGSTLGMTGG
jgi:hypothetical protein